MNAEELREQMPPTGVQLLGERPYEQITSGALHQAAGVSKGLLYHYFPTKKDFVLAVLREAADELSAVTAPDPELAPLEQGAREPRRVPDLRRGARRPLRHDHPPPRGRRPGDPSGTGGQPRAARRRAA